MEKLFDGVGAAIAAMPPLMAAVVILGLALAALAYFWRQAGRDAERERQKAEEARANSESAKLSALHGKTDDLFKAVNEIHAGVQVLLDRRR